MIWDEDREENDDAVYRILVWMRAGNGRLLQKEKGYMDMFYNGGINTMEYYVWRFRKLLNRGVQAHGTPGTVCL